MKINTHRKLSKKAILTIAMGVVILGIVGYGVYASAVSQWPFSAKANPSFPSEIDTESSGSTDNQSKDDSSPKQNEAASKQSPTKTPANNEPVGGDSKPSNRSLTVTITGTDQVEGELRIRTLIEKVTNEGSCSLVVTKGNSRVTRSAAIQALPSASTCQGFRIPLSEFSKGVWTIHLKATIDSQVGDTTQTVEIN